MGKWRLLVGQLLQSGKKPVLDMFDHPFLGFDDRFGHVEYRVPDNIDELKWILAHVGWCLKRRWPTLRRAVELEVDRTADRGNKRCARYNALSVLSGGE